MATIPSARPVPAPVPEPFQLASAAGKVGLWDWNVLTNEVKWTGAVYAIHGVDPATFEVTLDNFIALIHPDDVAHVQEQIQQALAQDDIYELEFRIRRPDGKIAWVFTKGTVLREDGRPVRMIGATLDVTASRQADDARVRLAAIVESSDDAILSKDLNGIIVTWNRGAERLFGYTETEVVGRPVTILIPADRLDEEPGILERIHRGERIDHYETLRRRKDGTLVDVSLTVSPLRDATGRVVGASKIARDITARKQAALELAKAHADALAASRAKDDFLAALSHELRTPLSPVLLLASDAVNNPALPREIRENFEMIRTNISLEARLIDDLLDLTRITRGKMPLEMQRVDVHDVLRDALANIRQDIEAKHMELQQDLAATHTVVLGDPVRLQQVLWNLLKNAVKFTPDDGWIRVTTDATSCPGTIVIAVSDNGLGMTADELAGVFAAFRQGEHASGAGSHRFGGLGLGLAISQRLVELHSGRISAASHGRNCGAVFTVALPLAASQAVATPSAPATSAPAVPGTGSNRRILLVEDHASTREVVQKLLTRRNYDVTPANSAASARALAAGQHFDFVVSDVGLPDGDGYQLMTELRTLQPGLLGVAISGYGMENDLHRSQDAGYARHLVKPVSITALERALADLERLLTS